MFLINKFGLNKMLTICLFGLVAISGSIINGSKAYAGASLSCIPQYAHLTFPPTLVTISIMKEAEDIQNLEQCIEATKDINEFRHHIEDAISKGFNVPKIMFSVLEIITGKVAKCACELIF